MALLTNPTETERILVKKSSKIDLAKCIIVSCLHFSVHCIYIYFLQVNIAKTSEHYKDVCAFILFYIYYIDIYIYVYNIYKSIQTHISL